MIWPPIFFFEALFAFAQLSPSYRARAVVREGAKFWFIQLCLGQIAWTIFFSLKLFLLSLFAIGIMLGSLVSLLFSEHFADSSDKRSREYWLFRFPFRLHVGWVFVLTAVNLLIVSDDAGAGAVVYLTLSLVLLAGLLLIAFFFLTVVKDTDYIVPLVIIWGFVSSSNAHYFYL